MEAAHPKYFFATLDGCSGVSYKFNQKFIIANFPSQSWALKWESQFGETPGESNCGFVRLLACSLDNIRRWWEDYNCDIGGFSSQYHL